MLVPAGDRAAAAERQKPPEAAGDCRTVRVALPAAEMLDELCEEVGASMSCFYPKACLNHEHVSERFP